MDLDDDLDVVAIALQPSEVLDRFGKEHFDSICWLEQTARGEFHRRTLELGDCKHMAREKNPYAETEGNPANGRRFAPFRRRRSVLQFLLSLAAFLQEFQSQANIGRQLDLAGL